MKTKKRSKKNFGNDDGYGFNVDNFNDGICCNWKSYI